MKSFRSQKVLSLRSETFTKTYVKERGSLKSDQISVFFVFFVVPTQNATTEDTERIRKNTEQENPLPARYLGQNTFSDTLRMRGPLNPSDKAPNFSVAKIYKLDRLFGEQLRDLAVH